jgi:hypothetical protein
MFPTAMMLFWSLLYPPSSRENGPVIGPVIVPVLLLRVAMRALPISVIGARQRSARDANRADAVVLGSAISRDKEVIRIRHVAEKRLTRADDGDRAGAIGRRSAA